LSLASCRGLLAVPEVESGHEQLRNLDHDLNALYIRRGVILSLSILG
jgi:hypothetical protein